MEEVNGVNEVNVDFIPSNEEAGFGISPDEVKLMIALGLALPNSKSPFAKIDQELARLIADCFCEAQNKWRAENNCTSPVPTELPLFPPQIVREVERRTGVQNPRAQRRLFGQLFDS